MSTSASQVGEDVRVRAAIVENERSSNRGNPLAPMRFGEQFPVYLATFTLFVAYITPTAFSLAIRMDEVAPAAKDAMLPLAIGLPGIAVVLTNPLFGILSDRTRSRFGRRRPWMLAGALLGLAGAIFVGIAPGAWGVIAGWSIAYVGYSLCAAITTAYWGDRLPESQRGKVMGVNGALTNIAPIMGYGIAGAFAAQTLLMFLIPGLIAFIGAVVFILRIKDPQYTGHVPQMTRKEFVQGFYFNPRRYPDLGWVWISRALVFLGVSFMGIYNVYLLLERLGMTASEVGALVAALGLPGVVAAIAGAAGSGWLSDRLKTRKPFLLASGVLFAVGMITIGTTSSLPQYVAGMLVCNFAIGVYGAVDQALGLDVIPHHENQNGRYLALFGLGSTLPQAIGPFIAALVVAAGYSSVYFVGALCALIGGFLILPVKARMGAGDQTNDSVLEHAA